MTHSEPILLSLLDPLFCSFPLSFCLYYCTLVVMTNSKGEPIYVFDKAIHSYHPALVSNINRSSGMFQPESCDSIIVKCLTPLNRTSAPPLEVTDINVIHVGENFPCVDRQHFIPKKLAPQTRFVVKYLFIFVRPSLIYFMDQWRSDRHADLRANGIKKLHFCFIFYNPTDLHVRELFPD